MSTDGDSSQGAGASLAARIRARLFEALAAHGAFEAMALGAEVASSSERWRAWAGGDTTPRGSRPRTHGGQLRYQVRYRRPTWRHPNGR